MRAGDELAQVRDALYTLSAQVPLTGTLQGCRGTLHRDAAVLEELSESADSVE